jgi:hypothetical protein
MRALSTLPRGQCRPVHEGLYKTDELSAEDQHARERRYTTHYTHHMSALRVRSDPFRKHHPPPASAPTTTSSPPSPPRRNHAALPHPRVWNPASLIPPLVSSSTRPSEEMTVSEHLTVLRYTVLWLAGRVHLSVRTVRAEYETLTLTHTSIHRQVDPHEEAMCDRVERSLTSHSAAAAPRASSTSHEGGDTARTYEREQYRSPPAPRVQRSSLRLGRATAPVEVRGVPHPSLASPP